MAKRKKKPGAKKRRRKKRKQMAYQVWDYKLKKYVTKGQSTLEEEKKAVATVRKEAAFKLIVPRHVMDKISWWMHKTDKEVSGFGSLDFDKEKNTFTVRDAILLKQEVGPASTEIDPVAMGKAMYRMREEPNGLKWHWHSHVNMGVFWSSDDMELIRSLGQQGWILATVFNYAEERKTAYYTQTKLPHPTGGSIEHDVFINDIPTSVINYVQEDQYAVWDKEYAENVTEEKTWSYVGLNGGGGTVTDATEDKVNPYGDAITGYDDQGYGKAPAFRGGEIYNPCFDKTLTEEQKYQMVDELAFDEIEFLEKHSPSFAHLMKNYMIRAAKQCDIPGMDDGFYSNFHENKN